MLITCILSVCLYAGIITELQLLNKKKCDMKKIMKLLGAVVLTICLGITAPVTAQTADTGTTTGQTTDDGDDDNGKLGLAGLLGLLGLLGLRKKDDHRTTHTTGTHTTGVR